MIKLLAFDLDGTLTQHRSKLEEKNRSVLYLLSQKYKLIMIGAGGCMRIYQQMREFPIDIIGYYGMQESKMENGSPKILRTEFTTVDKEFFTKGANEMRKLYGYTEFKGETIEFHDSGMVTIPILGTKADVNDKVAFDPDRKKRAVMYPFVTDYYKDYTVFIGGSSSFDIVSKKFNKYNALARYCQENGYDINTEVCYFGDDFGQGGNDEQIKLGGVKHVFVDDYRNFEKLTEFLLK